MTEEPKPSENREDKPSQTHFEASSAATETDPSADESTDNTASDPIAELEQRAMFAESRAAELQDRLLRTAAEQENYRKRMTREKDDLRKFAISELIEDLIPAIDNLKLGLLGAEQYGSDEAKQVALGFEMVARQIQQILEDKGLKKIDPIGEDFDPNSHEAASQIPSSEHDEGKVIQVLRTGYTLNERLIRPATVIVSSGKPQS